jgi:hypothetical protein
MRTTNWLNAVSGDFAGGGKWDDGKPRANTDAVIAATGAAYVVRVDSADAAHSLTLNSADATLREKAGGSLDLGTLNIESGTAVLTQANTLGSIVMTGGELDFTRSAALGNAAISLTNATLSATGNAQIANDISDRQGRFEVGNGTTLKLDGHLSFDTTVGERLYFLGNTSKGTPDGSGVVDLDGTIGALGTHPNTLFLKGETLGTSIANNSDFATFLSDVRLDFGNHSVLDLTHQDNVTLNRPAGSEEILNSGTHDNLDLVDASFDGTIKGDFTLTLEGGGFLGTIALKADDQIHVVGISGFADLRFVGDAPAIDLENQSGTNGGTQLNLNHVTSSGAPPAIDMGTGQNNILDIKDSSIGTISNFGGHNGGTDTIVLQDGGGHGKPTLQYDPNEAGTGGELIVTYAGGPTITLELAGHYMQSDFTGNFTDIECSAEQSSPHARDIVHLLDALI